MFVVYLIACTATDRRYIGITTKTAEQRFARHFYDASRGSESMLHVSMRKYGEGAFSVREITTAVNIDEACAIERGLIAEYGTFWPRGFNLTSGGEMRAGFRVHHLTREKQRQGRLGKKHTEEAKKKMSAWRTGRPLSAETRAKMAASHLGKKLSAAHMAAVMASLTPERRTFLSEYARLRKRKPMSDEARQKLREAALRQFAHPEARIRLSEIAKERMRDPAVRAHLAECARNQAARRRAAMEGAQ